MWKKQKKASKFLRIYGGPGPSYFHAGVKALLPAQTSSGEYGWEKLKPHGGLLGGSKRTLRSNSGFITAGAWRHNCKKFVKFMGKSNELLWNTKPKRTGHEHFSSPAHIFFCSETNPWPQAAPWRCIHKLTYVVPSRLQNDATELQMYFQVFPKIREVWRSLPWRLESVMLWRGILGFTKFGDMRANNFDLR